MPINFNTHVGGCAPRTDCPDQFGCPSDRCPDFIIRRHDTKPAFKVCIEDCDGPMDFRGLIIEANMWALARLKDKLDETTTYFRLADNIGFNQIMIGDIIVMDRVRMPERMLVTGFDETNYFVQVQRGYHGTTPSSWKRGTRMRIFRTMNAPAESEMEFRDETTVEGNTEKDVLSKSMLVYEWQPEDTCLPGCYWLEFKVLKMIDMVWYLPGGHWDGPLHRGADGYYYTGTMNTDASVRTSFDQVESYYKIDHTVWAGEVHLYTDNLWYTGLVHNDGSVQLTQTGIPSSETTAYNDTGKLELCDVSLIPSFADEGLTPYYFGCVLGEGVESVRRFPVSGEGFLVAISDSPTAELF